MLKWHEKVLCSLADIGSYEFSQKENSLSAGP